MSRVNGSIQRDTATDKVYYFQGSNDIELAAGGTAITGSLTATRVPFASGVTTLVDDADLTYDNTNNVLNVGNATSSSNGTIVVGGSGTGIGNITGGGGALNIVGGDLTLASNPTHRISIKTNTVERIGIENSGIVAFSSDTQYGTTPATVGTIRLPNATSIAWRNAANSANAVLQYNSSDVLVFNGAFSTGSITSSVLSANVMVKTSGVAGTLANATAGTDYTSPTGTEGLSNKTITGSTITGYAPLASPALTGTPIAPTATAGTNTTQLATTAFVTTAVAGAGWTTTGNQSGLTGIKSGSFQLNTTGAISTNGATITGNTTSGTGISGVATTGMAGSFQNQSTGSPSVLVSQLSSYAALEVNGGASSGTNVWANDGSTYTGIPFRYTKNSVDLWIVSNTGQQTWDGATATTTAGWDASKNLVSITNTGTGNAVRATSPTLVTPVLGAATATSLIVNPGAGANAITANPSGGGGAFVSNVGATGTLSGYWQVAGNFAGSISHPTNTTTNYNVTSDYRIKENLEPLKEGLSVIEKLNPIIGNYKEDPTKTKMAMFIAHEVQEVVPIAVTGKKDAMKLDKETGKMVPDIQQLDASKLIPYIVRGMQEQQKEMQEQQDQIAELREEIKALKK